MMGGFVFRTMRPNAHCAAWPSGDAIGPSPDRMKAACAAAIYTLIETRKLNYVDPQAWLAFVLAKLPDHPAKSIDELLPWNWKAAQAEDQATQVIAAA